MAVQLDIVVSDIAATLSAGYTHIKIYRSSQETTGFTELTTSSNRIALVSGQSNYTFVDETGTTKMWYKRSFFDGSSESTLSSAFQGTYTDTKFLNPTYPADETFTSEEYYLIDRIRLLIGDPKELNRDYISEQGTGFDSISEDGKTHTLLNPRGYPLSIEHNDVGLTTASGAEVRDYQFITISGTVDVSAGSTDTLDVWYYHFRYSDTEILTAYNSQLPPPQLTADQVSTELKLVCTALDLLESEVRQFGTVSATEVDIYQEIRINPKGGLDARQKDLVALRKRKDKLIQDILFEEADSNIFGVLID